MAKDIVDSLSAWAGLLKDLFRQIEDRSIEREHLRLFLEHKNPFEPGNISPLLRDWEKFYQDTFQITVNLSEVKIPEKEKGYDRLIVVIPEMSLKRIFLKCMENFPSCLSEQVNLEQIKSQRSGINGTYAIWCRNTIETDNDLRGLSTDDLKRKAMYCITLEERMLLELKYYNETAKHMDMNYTTLCAGSRSNRGFVPCVHRLMNFLSIFEKNPADSNSDIGSRQVIV